MKNLPCIIALSTIISLALLTACAVLGVSLPYALIASDIIAISCCAGVIAFFVAEYTPNRSRPYIELGVAEQKREFAPVTLSQRCVPRPVGLLVDDGITVNLMATLGLRREPATVSLM
jgi:hypothetical protein